MRPLRYLAERRGVFVEASFGVVVEVYAIIFEHIAPCRIFCRIFVALVRADLPIESERRCCGISADRLARDSLFPIRAVVRVAGLEHVGHRAAVSGGVAEVGAGAVGAGAHARGVRHGVAAAHPSRECAAAGRRRFAAALRTWYGIYRRRLLDVTGGDSSTLQGETPQRYRGFPNSTDNTGVL